MFRPITSRKGVFTGLLVLELPALMWSLFVIEVGVRGLGKPSPWQWPTGPLLLGTALAGTEEGLRGLLWREFGDKGLYGFTAIWVVAHQVPIATLFIADPSPLRLLSDCLLGVFFIKLWRGPLWPLAFVAHIGFNVFFVLALQGLLAL